MDSENKYHRTIFHVHGPANVLVDVYSVLEAFEVTCPARQHAIKKLLCAGIRGKGNAMQDLNDSLISIRRAVEMQELRESGDKSS